MKERTYIISKQQQYVQSVDLKAGRYTINYSIRTPNTSHRFAFLKKSGGWQEFEMQNLTPGKWHRKDEAKLSFYLLEDVVAFNLCTSPVSVSSPVMIQRLMLEEGMNASTAKPNELDLLESIEDLFDMEHIFKPEKTLVQPETPESLQQDDYTPEGWDDDPVTATYLFPYVWHSFRQRIGDVWGAFYPPTLYSSYSKDGEPGATPMMIEIRGGTSLKNPDKTGGVSSTTLTVVKHGFESSIKWEWLYQGSWQATSWTGNITINYNEDSGLFVNDVATLRCVSTVNPEVFTVVSITAVWDGKDGTPGADGKDGKDGEDGTPGADGKDGKDGKDGEDGVTPVVTQLIPSVILIGKSAGGDPQPNTFTVRHLDGSGNAVNVWMAAFGSHDGDVWYPIENAEYASFIVVNVAAYPYKYFVVRSYSPSFFPAPEEIYWNTPYLLSVSVGMYEDGKDGLPGIPGQVPVQKEWVADDRHRNSDEIVDYIYVRGSNSETSYWYQLINKTDTEGIKAGAAPTGGAIPEGYKAVTWMPALSVKTLIAEEANLANLIFKEGKLISIKGNTFAGEEINYGEYTEYNFASTTTQPGVDSASWLEIPPSTIRWIRYKKNTGSSWTVKQGGTGTGQWTMQFATAPEGETWYSSYSANRFWARVKVGGESDYGKPFRFTPAGGYDFIPNAMIDGINGEISGDKVIANNIRNKIWLAYSNNPTEIAAILGKGQSINLSAYTAQPVDYSWYNITLPNDKKLVGTILTIHFPTASQKRYKIKTENINGVFYVSEPVKVLSELQVVNGVRGTIELKGVWDEINQSLDWHVISQVRYMLNMTQPTLLRPSPYLLPNELIYRGNCSVDNTNPATLTKHYQSIITQVSAAKNTYGTTKVIITVPMPTYFSSTGAVLRRAAHNSGTLLRLEAMPNVGKRTMDINPFYSTNSHWYFEVSVYDSTGAAIYGGFDFSIYTNDYLIQSQWMDNKLDGN